MEQSDYQKAAEGAPIIVLDQTSLDPLFVLLDSWDLSSLYPIFNDEQIENNKKFLKYLQDDCIKCVSKLESLHTHFHKFRIKLKPNITKTEIRQKITFASEKLDKFLESVKNVEPDLLWIRSLSGHESEEDFTNYRMRRSADGISEILANFKYISFYEDEVAPEFLDEMESGDLWYNRFRKEECRHGGCKRGSYMTGKNKMKIRTEHKRHNNKKKNKNKMFQENRRFSQPFFKFQSHSSKLEPNFNKNPQNNFLDPDYDEYNNVYVQETTTNSQPVYFDSPLYSFSKQEKNPESLNPKNSNNFPFTGSQNQFIAKPQNFQGNSYNFMPPKNTFPSFKNPSSNFANLSENILTPRQLQFQSNMQPVILKDQVEKTKNDLSHEANYKLSKFEQDAMAKTIRSNQSWFNSQHNPFQQQRMVPIASSKQIVEVKDENRDDSASEVKRSLDPDLEIKLLVSDHLISRGLGPSLPSDSIAGPKAEITINDVISGKSLENIQNRFKRNSDDNEFKGRKLLSVDDEFELENSETLKRFKRISDLHWNASEMKIEDESSLKETTVMPQLKKDENTSSVTEINTTTAILESNKNGTQNVSLECHKIANDIPSFDGDIFQENGEVFGNFTPIVQARPNRDVRNSYLKARPNIPLDDLINGKLPVQLVSAVYQLAESNNDFRREIWPALKNRKFTTHEELQGFDMIKNENNFEEIQRSEQMLRQVMETLNSLIQQQVHSRTCVPLRPDLKEFYDLILKSRNENDEQIGKRKNREYSHRTFHQTHSNPSSYYHDVYKRNDVHFEVPVIREKCSVVKKLLNQYDYLPLEDQQKAKDVRDLLQMHLAFLEEVEIAEEQQIERLKRQQVVKQQNSTSTDNSATTSSALSQDGDKISSKLIKLIQTSDFIQKHHLQKSDLEDYQSFQDNYYL